MITLYTARTGNGYRASILLEELALSYRTVTIGFAPDDARPAPFLLASPLAKIPAIVDDDTSDGRPLALAESLAIALYLTEKTGRLIPGSAAGRARAAEWGAIVVSGFSASLAGIFFARRFDAAAGDTGHAALIAKYASDLTRAFGALDARLQQSAYLAGEEFSYADALAAPLPNTATAMGFDLAPYAALQRWRDAVYARPGVRAGMNVPA